ncbi:MAG: transposase [Thermotogota bacterium]|nr:transposase [Thermotogota bacterium]
MNILTSIEAFVKYHFGEYFENISAFYLKNILILVQGLLSARHDSISKIAENPLNKRAHTTLTRFLNTHNVFWSEMEKLFQEAIRVPSSKRVLIADDSLLEKRGKQIPFVSKTFDHCTQHFKNAQTILTIGETVNGLFYPLIILFSHGQGKTKQKRKAKAGKIIKARQKEEQQQSKNDLLVNWLKANQEKADVIVADSWYTNAYLIEACHKWFHSTFVGQLKGNLILKLGKKRMSVKELIWTSKMNRSVLINGKMIQYRSYTPQVQSIRTPVKIVVTELENGTRAALVSSNSKMVGENIIRYYAHRWSIESFFKMAKQSLGLGDCHLRSEKAQRHYMILVSIAYLRFSGVSKKLLTISMKL